ncbi:hypothetical protein DFH09DRAFT_1203834 [Mycena vulgaris]|nr:hypothetical protein DFH09DRAFT_1203834 [Mycena vulgaris]
MPSPSSNDSAHLLPLFTSPRPGPCPHRSLFISSNPLPADHERVIRLTKYRAEVVAKCANCAELAVECDFSESGVPCPPCAVLAIPDCDFTDPYFFMANLAHRRDIYLHEQRATLVTAVRENYLAPSQFEREYEHASTWFYSAAQGAITRCLINCRATDGLTLRGYQRLAESSADAGILSRFLALAYDTHIHPSVLQTVTNRLHTLFVSLLGA